MVFNAYDVLVVDVPRSGFAGKFQAIRKASFLKERFVGFSVLPPQLCPMVQIVEFSENDGGLNGIEPEVATDCFVKILGLGSVDP